MDWQRLLLRVGLAVIVIGAVLLIGRVAVVAFGTMTRPRAEAPGAPLARVAVARLLESARLVVPSSAT